LDVRQEVVMGDVSKKKENSTSGSRLDVSLREVVVVVDA